ncbi:hypothetical protein D8674_017693 [Pyrus ussuriensis x Pyrus communis]|uniref:Uncharacterized protein n=1 Tax=Pyrus ussuriensis x Pyrus communis TaxID=2448454 RepID=A0A5N5HHF6_9ROSA|nr:hypothetical protein D8674_017693 [Pyrus ussuriensis x Pyrus communis]
MAAAPSPSPALSNTSSGDTRPTTTATAAAPPVAPFHQVHRTDTPPKTLRGLNKPKCKQCGNVARSRCPYESCKSCCSKAQNPCYIHVLKTNTTFPDKAPTSNSPLFDHQSTDASPSGNSHRVASFRQLSINFAQFNNLHIPLHSKKPLTRKDAVAINEWRISKLREYKDGNIEVENEAFDRYMQNVSLLEQVFSVESIAEESMRDGSSISNQNTTTNTTEDNTEAMVSGLKLKLRSNPMRTSNFRKRIQQIVDEGLKKLQKCEFDDGGKKSSVPNGLDKGPKKEETRWAGRTSALGDLIDKLNKARNKEDLKACLDLKSQLFSEHKLTGRTESEDADIMKKHTAKNDSEPGKEWNCSFPKVISATEIDQETLKSVNAHFCTLEQIEGL